MIRRATEKDVEALTELLYQVHDVHANGRPDIFVKGKKKFSEEELREVINDNTKPIFVAVDENDVAVGHIFCIFKEIKDADSLVDRKVLFVDDLCVNEKCRGQKIGEKLYEYVLQIAKDNGCHSVTLDIWNFNEGALRFYERIGMKPLKTIMETRL